EVRPRSATAARAVGAGCPAVPIPDGCTTRASAPPSAATPARRPRAPAAVPVPAPAHSLHSPPAPRWRAAAPTDKWIQYAEYPAAGGWRWHGGSAVVHTRGVRPGGGTPMRAAAKSAGRWLHG